MKALSLQDINPEDEVKKRVNHVQLTPLTTPGKPGDIYVWEKGNARWHDGGAWPFSKYLGWISTMLPISKRGSQED